MSWAHRFVLAMARRRAVQIGLLLLLIGIPELVIANSKAGEYRARLDHLAPARPPDPTELYPKVRADDERRAVYLGKIGYYELLGSAGRILVLFGVASIVLGLVQHGTSAPPISLSH